MRTVITGGGFLVVTALCVLIHCSIISTNMRDNEVSNSLDKASDYAVDVMGDIYLRLDYSQGNTAAYMQELIQGFCSPSVPIFSFTALQKPCISSCI